MNTEDKKIYKSAYYEKNREKLREDVRITDRKLRQQYGFGRGTVDRFGLNLAVTVYDKFNRQCTICGSDCKLVIHHIDNKGRNYSDAGLEPNDDLDNLLLLCSSCHSTIHRVGRPATYHKRVGQFDLEGSLIKEHESHRLAAVEVGISYKAISSCVRGRNKTAGGYIWRSLK